MTSSGVHGGDVTVKRSDLSMELAMGVVSMISEDGLAAGQAIPALRPLAERFGVAVPTMREALRRLEGLGMLEFRHGSGIYVGANADRMVLANVLAPRPSRGQLVQLLEARLLIEPPIAALAAQVRDAEGLARLEASLDDAHQCLRTGDDKLWTVNIDIHRAVAATTGNQVLAETLDSLALVHAQDQREILLVHGDAELDHTEHQRIVEYIAAGDSEAARVAMHQHLEDVLRVIRAGRT